MARGTQIFAIVLVVLAAWPSTAPGQAPVGTAFTYQGQLKQSGLPVTGTADFQFSLWDGPPVGTQIGTTQNINNVTVTNGLFTVTLDFGASAFTGDARWLEIAVRSPAGSGSYKTLTPRQELKPVPYAIRAAQNWALTGNAGTNPLTNFLGTTDNQPLELKVNGARALRLEPTTSGGPNVIGGDSSNTVSAGVYTATIGGGADNTVSWATGTVGGGILNTASSTESVVAGGAGNTASGGGSAALGGVGNVASGSYSTVSGGLYNSADGAYSSVPGGQDNHALGVHSLAAGSKAYAYHDGTFVWADHTTGPGLWASTAANQFLVKAAGGVGINTNAPASALHVAGNVTVVGTEILNSSGPGNGQMSVLTASDTLDANGDFYVDVPASLYLPWQLDNYMFKVEVFVSLDANSSWPHNDKGSAYSMALIGKQRGDGLEDFYEAISHANDATVTFAYSTPAADVLRVSVNTNRSSGILYRVTIKISH